MTSQSLKAGQVADPRADLMGQETSFRIELPHLAGGVADEIDLQLKGNTAAAG
jgi:hypothetical protein